MLAKKHYIIDLMLSFSNDYAPRMLCEIPKPDQIRLLNTMVYLAIYQKLANNHCYDVDRIVEYFEFDEYETYLLKVSCCRLRKFGLIDEEYEWIQELLPIDKPFIYTVVYDRNDIGNSTIEIYQLPNGSPLASSERSMTFMPKKLPNINNEPVKPKVPIKPKGKIIKKNGRNRDFER